MTAIEHKHPRHSGVKFWNRAIAEGAHLKPPAKMTPVCWERWLGITWEHIYAKQRLRPLGRNYGISHEWARHIIDRTTEIVRSRRRVANTPAQRLKTLLQEPESPLIAQVLSEVSRATYSRYVQGEKPLFVTIGRVARSAGIPWNPKTHTPQIISQLEGNGIPVGRVSQKVKNETRVSYFVFAGHLNLAVNTLKNGSN